VAKNSTVVPVRVLDCSGAGSLSGVIAGLDWIAGSHPSGAAGVANLSLGGGASQSLDDAVRRVSDKGVPVVVAAGNSNFDACNSSPARAAQAITVGATTPNDSRASYSNFGTCLDLFAPGSNITSAWHTGSTATNTISGTSMAAPHVAGVAALLLQGTAGVASAVLAESITSAATPGKVSGAGSGSPNLLLFSRIGSTPVNPDPLVAHLNDLVVDISNGRWLSARSTLEVIIDADGSNGGPAADVAVTGEWRNGGSLVAVQTVITDSSGQASASVSARVPAGDVTFCVTSMSGTRYVSRAFAPPLCQGQDLSEGELEDPVAPEDPVDSFGLSASAYRVSGRQRVDLVWSAAARSSLQVLRDGVVIFNGVADTGSLTDPIDARGGGSYRYQICDASVSGSCSAEVVVSF
jgi:hypothetical protein